MSTGSQEMASQAEVLKEIIGFFKIEQLKKQKNRNKQKSEKYYKKDTNFEKKHINNPIEEEMDNDFEKF